MPRMSYSEMSLRRWAKHHQPIEQRLWSKVIKAGPDDCWLWTGAGRNSRYGMIRFNGKQQGAHRVAFIITVGLSDPSLEVCHTCDNTKCCNPKHLFEGTHQDNMDDRSRKGRWRQGKNPWTGTHRKAPTTLYSDAFVRQVRMEFKPYKVTAKILAARHKIPFASMRHLIYNTILD